MPNVAFVREELARLIPQYDLISDCVDGEHVIKKAGEKYLPAPSVTDDAAADRKRYDAYRQRAVYYNACRPTLAGLVGQVFAKPPAVELPTSLDPLIKNATGDGLTLDQLAKKALGYNIAFSRCGIFVDYPDTSEEGGASVAELEAGAVRPTLYVYAPQNIINWRTVDRGAEEILSLVVIWETYIYEDDGFEAKHAIQFRVLRLDESGHYVHELWREPTPTKFNGNFKTKRGGNYQLYTTFFPTGYDGNRLSEIPFMFIGSENNDVQPDAPNFYDLASLNISHYRNSADYEESCFVVGQPTPVLTGLSEHWVEKVLKGSVNFGSRGGIPMPVGGDAKLLQAAPNTMIKEAMDAKERQMVALGAKLVEQKQVQRTATEASLEVAAQTSVLSSAADNVSDAFEWALGVALSLLGNEGAKVTFRLNSDFDIAKASPEQRRQVVEEWVKGAITFEEMREVMQKSGIATLPAEEAKSIIEADKEAESARKIKEAQALPKPSTPANVGK